VAVLPNMEVVGATVLVPYAGGGNVALCWVFPGGFSDTPNPVKPADDGCPGAWLVDPNNEPVGCAGVGAAAGRESVCKKCQPSSR